MRYMLARSRELPFLSSTTSHSASTGDSHGCKFLFMSPGIVNVVKKQRAKARRLRVDEAKYRGETKCQEPRV